MNGFRSTFGFVALAIGIAALALWWRGGARGDAAPSTGEQPASVTTAPARAIPPKVAPPAASPAVSDDPAAAAMIAKARAVYEGGSLRGSQRDGRITIGGDGRPVADIELRRMFDWYLAALGELTPAEIRAFLLDAMRREHGDAIATRIVDVFDRYRLYLEAATAVDDRDPAVRLDRLMALRRRFLGEPAATAMFGSDEAYARHVIERIKLASDPTISKAERDRRLDWAGAGTGTGTEPSADDRAQALVATSAIDIEAQTRALDASGADAATRHAERAATWGEAAGTRLDALDRQRADWDARIAAYRRARDAAREDPAIDDAGEVAAIDRLRREMFDEAERRRVESLEAIGEL